MVAFALTALHLQARQPHAPSFSLHAQHSEPASRTESAGRISRGLDVGAPCVASDIASAAGVFFEVDAIQNLLWLGRKTLMENVWFNGFEERAVLLIAPSRFAWRSWRSCHAPLPFLSCPRLFQMNDFSYQMGRREPWSGKLATQIIFVCVLQRSSVRDASRLVKTAPSLSDDPFLVKNLSPASHARIYVWGIAAVAEHAARDERGFGHAKEKDGSSS